jgi:hypothetical protein
MSRWRKKPVAVDAWQFLPAGRCEEPPAWIDRRWFREDVAPKGDGTVGHRAGSHMLIPTPEGVMRAEFTDWIIRGIKGEVYPCKAEVFAATYEPIHDQ